MEQFLKLHSDGQKVGREDCRGRAYLQGNQLRKVDVGGPLFLIGIFEYEGTRCLAGRPAGRPTKAGRKAARWRWEPATETADSRGVGDERPKQGTVARQQRNANLRR